MTDAEKILTFKRLYVRTNNLAANFGTAVQQGNLQVADVDQAITCIDEMIALWPLSFSEKINDISEPVLLINLKDPEDAPTETEKTVEGTTTYILPEKTVILEESRVQAMLEDWKFRIIKYIGEQAPEESTKQKYAPLIIPQAKKCLAFYPDKRWLHSWQMDKVAQYANQIGWQALQEETGLAELEAALALLEEGYHVSNWNERKYIKNTYVRLLLKMDRGETAYPVVAGAFERDADYADFLDLKNDEQFLRWKEEEAVRKAAVEQRKKQEQEALSKAISEEQEKIKDKFINPGHALVQQHADMLNIIKQRMLAYRLRVLHEAKPEKVEDLETYFKHCPLTVEELEAWELKHELKLPGELKVYFMEIGGGGDLYFYMGGILRPQDLAEELIPAMKKPFPITGDKIHDVDNFYRVKAWVFPDAEDWITEGVFPEGTNMRALFGLPVNSEITDGCMILGNSAAQNELYLIMNGEFEGEVWSDRLQYGAEVRGCFGPATSKRLKLLEYIADSLGKSRRAGDEDEGDWM